MKKSLSTDPFEISFIQNIVLVTLEDGTSFLIKKNIKPISVMAKFGDEPKNGSDRKSYCIISGVEGVNSLTSKGFGEIWIETPNIFIAKQLALQLGDIFLLGE